VEAQHSLTGCDIVDAGFAVEPGDLAAFARSDAGIVEGQGARLHFRRYAARDAIQDSVTKAIRRWSMICAPSLDRMRLTVVFSRQGIVASCERPSGSATECVAFLRLEVAELLEVARIGDDGRCLLA